MRVNRKLAAVVALIAAVAVIAVGCGDDKDDSSSSGSESSSKPEIKIGTQAFGESEILGQIYGQVLESQGYKVTYQSFKDRAAIYAAVDSGDINFVPEYAASAVEFLNGNAGEASPDVDATVKALQAQLAKQGLVALEPSEAVDSNSLVVTKETSTSENVTKISDLKEGIKLGGPQDCPSNAGCLPALKSTYGIDLSSTFVPLDASGPLTKSALKEGDVQVAVIFSTDSAIAENGWVVLEDDKGIFNADNIIPVVTQALADDADLVKLVNDTSAAITTANLTALNKQYDVDKEDADAIAEAFIADNDLG
ncbi:ABC transporter substrate-binding protein [Dermatobacter hominis]|uniref:ABC transporter substrate-binding protein n=1 Tax=Dermatobacter hominis TaxID=2884263 RepID=UPI001D12CDA6|nr:ABC transporter substrate-binding protein [Dermatobacter hominis]UDY35136.1 ABC transporter substrate-binding protein [Dermatobacter hominis]